jgi:molybdenum cofactor cytidylyltransferase
MEIDCVIPAAGASSRMGAWKPLLPFASSTIAETTVGLACGALIGRGPDRASIRAILVTGYRGEELAARFAGKVGVLVVENRGWEGGQLGSIQKALPLVKGDFFFCLNADMPRLDPASFGRLWEARAPGLAVFASHEGVAGHPVLIPTAWTAVILKLPPSGRMRAFLEARPHSLVECGPGALADLDTREDYEGALAGGGGGGGGRS